MPPDLAAERIAPNVLKQGVSYLDRLGYQVVSDFVEDPKIFDPSVIDWQAVADGRQKVLIRQQPGPHNSMGRIKFMFPNDAGRLPARQSGPRSCSRRRRGSTAAAA